MIDIAFTSPPYNAHHMDIVIDGHEDKTTTKKYLADDDNRTDEEYSQFLKDNLKLLIEYTKEVFYNIGVISGSKEAIVDILNEYKDNFKDLIYWDKANPTPTMNKHVISSATELIIAFGQNSSRAFSQELGFWRGIIEGPTASSSNEYADIHKATFPLYLPSEIVQRFTEKGGTVLDCFGGTGTTMIACEELGRKCFMIELEPRYCDVIINRWEQYTGRKAEKVVS